MKPEKQLRIAFTAGSVSRAAGGLFFSVRHLGFQLQKLSVDVSVFGVRDGDTERDLQSWDALEPKVFEAVGLRSFAFSSGLERAVLDCDAGLLHTHGIWQHPSMCALNWKRLKQRPHIVSPRGMLEPWAWRHQAWKKRPVWWLWERRNLQSANLLHATSQQEAQALRQLGLRPPIAVIPNGVIFPEVGKQIEIADQNLEPRVALFLSRIHPKKGLLNLVEAWSRIRPAGWKMIVCGPDEAGHLEQVKNEVHEAKLATAFEFLPPVYGKEKEELLSRAELFVLPTFSENFGIAIAEALASGIPAITTKGAPWADLETHRCGWWIDIGVAPLAETLKQATNLPEADLHEMGIRGRSLVERNYSWPSIAKQMRAVYQWVLGSNVKPECVTEI